jgi:ubiquinone/menaquinone biosynthesis C-methylase UbiE
MQPHDTARFGDVIMDPAEQQRWCRAVMLGGLPFMWKKASVVLDLVYGKLALKPGEKVLLLGESLESCGFIDDLRAQVGPSGEVRVIDITDEARDAYFAGKRGTGGQLATWRYDYTRDIPDAYFDCVTVIQGVQHTDDWRATGQELLRIMKGGRNIVLAEITFSPDFRMKIGLDIHIEYVFEKIFSRIGFSLDDFPYYSPQELVAAFTGLVDDPGTFVWKGIEVFWGRKA